MPAHSRPRVAVAVADADLRARVLRLAAMAGVPVGAGSGPPAPGGWHAADAAVIDAAVALASPDVPVRRRPRALVVTDREPAPQVWQAALRVGAEGVAELPRDERRVLSWLAAVVEPAVRGRLVCCVGARGGAGASVLAAAVALSAASQSSALLVDVDPSGGGVDVLLGMERVSGARWSELADASGVVAAEALAAALPTVGALRVLSGTPGQAALPSAALEAVVAAGLRGHDLVVADLPRAAAPAKDRAVTLAETVVLVVPAEVRSVAAAAAAVPELAAACADLRLVVRHPGPGDLRPTDVAKAVGLAGADVWPWDRRLARVVDAGAFARSWRRTSVAGPARAIARRVGGDAP